MDFKDYYSTLGVAKTATDKEIKAAFRKLARKHHPDVNPGDKDAESRFKEINEAYEVLGDAAKRRKYDELGANWRQYEQAGAGFDPRHAGGGYNVNAGGAPGGFRSMTPDEINEMFGGGTSNPFSDFFQTFFGGMGAQEEAGGRRAGRSRSRARPGRDIEQELELTLEDAYHGAMRRFAMTQNGEAHTADVRIPPGVGEGSRVRVAGEGERGVGGAKPGDLYLRIRLAAHPVFERRGRDLYTRVEVPLTAAVLGGEADVPTLAGRPVRLKVPASTQNGQLFRLKGQGMPAAGKPEERGDLYATVDVKLPKELTSEQREHFEALKRSQL